MSFWSSDVVVLEEALEAQHGGPLLDEILSLMVFSCFSVIELRITIKLIRRLIAQRSEEPTRSNRIFGISNLLLSICYITGTILLLAHFAGRLDFLMRRYQVPPDWLRDDSLPVECYKNQGTTETAVKGTILHAFCNSPPDRTSLSTLDCLEVKQTLRRMETLDIANNVLFHCSFSISDALLVYRCYAMLERRWIMTIVAAIPLFASLVLSLVTVTTPAEDSRYYSKGLTEGYAVYGASGYSRGILLAAYVSLATNMIVSTTLIVHLWSARRKAKQLFSNAEGRVQYQIPYSKLIRILVESALPPLVLGISHIVAYMVFAKRYRAHGALWISLTILAPQIIAVRAAMQRKCSNPNPDTVDRIPTIPIAFKEQNETGSCDTLICNRSVRRGELSESRFSVMATAGNV